MISDLIFVREKSSILHSILRFVHGFRLFLYVFRFLLIFTAFIFFRFFNLFFFYSCALNNLKIRIMLKCGGGWGRMGYSFGKEEKRVRVHLNAQQFFLSYSARVRHEKG